MTPPRLGLCAFFLCLTLGFATGDEKGDAAKKQKAAADAMLKSAKLTATHTESDDLLVYSSFSDERTKKLAASAQKTYSAGLKALKVGADEKLWPGKLTLIVLPESRQYKGFVLSALKRSPTNRESFTFELRSDEPFVLVGTALGEKPSDEEMIAEAAGFAAAAVLQKKAGTGAAGLPDWFSRGFARSTHIHADGNAAKATAFHNKIKALYGKYRGNGFKPATVWTNTIASTETDTVATSFVEYLAFGPEAEKFPRLIQAMKPTEESPNPTIATALATVEWDADAIEVGWKKWIATGK